VDDALKSKGIIYFNVDTLLLFAPTHQNFWLRACSTPKTINSQTKIFKMNDRKPKRKQKRRN